MNEIAQRLGSEEWPLIDATLKAFSLPTTNSWGGSADAYVLRMIEDGSDTGLLELAEHVGFQFDTKPIRVDPPFWRKGTLRLFITHLAIHRELAAELQELLQDLGISCFVAHNDI